ncbi:hypothetical protein PENSUB_6532 [Penicillium subrubescens]|uniref:HAT C-terminal dimerisation domain-containing protein n=1 Tax=Penicillium subrubescens TaxID=1316194 RepID=A0A1Q5U0P1_9EURO|nr:hypothetical protein PENSUB_6532 [Penicillium subrubescens]
MAHGVFTIPASGAGVEHPFNSARDAYHYRTVRLNETAVQDLMMYRCISKSEVDTTNLAAGSGEGEELPTKRDSKQRYEEKKDQVNLPGSY